MRNTLLSLVLSIVVAACASGPRPVNVAAVRAEIDQAIQAQAADRNVTSMGKTTTERAVVFTTTRSGVRQEETWVKAGGAWRLEAATAISATD